MTKPTAREGAVQVNSAEKTPVTSPGVRDEVTPEWSTIEQSEEFRRLVAARLRFIIPATIFFLVYYIALPLSVAFARDLMNTKIIGDVNLAYLFALSQFFMVWIVGALYINQADKVFDRLAAAVRARFQRGGK